VVDLGGAMSIGTRHVEVVEGVIGAWIEPGQAFGDGSFAQPSFDAGRAKGSEDDEDDEEREKPWPEGWDSLEGFRKDAG